MTCPGEAYCSAHPSEAVLQEVADERRRQDAKWGIQNHPDGTDPEVFTPKVIQGLRDLADGDPTWAHILDEEFVEAMGEDDPVKLRAELVQVAAVSVAWIEAIDRRG